MAKKQNSLHHSQIFPDLMHHFPAKHFKKGRSENINGNFFPTNAKNLNRHFNTRPECCLLEKLFAAVMIICNFSGENYRSPPNSLQERATPETRSKKPGTITKKGNADENR
jgi:hypothetical protein